MTAHFIFDGAEDARVTLLLAHGAGAPMDSASMQAMAEAFAAVGFRVARFEFGYMAARRSGYRKLPPRADLLVPEYQAAVEELGTAEALIIGGKSMGGRVASLIADDLYAAGRIAGLLCVGYPFHPRGKPVQLRTVHLADLRAPTLICQGTRDPFGTREEVSRYELSGRVRLHWFEDGDHDLKPRKSVSGLTAADHLHTLAAEASAWAEGIAP